VRGQALVAMKALDGRSLVALHGKMEQARRTRTPWPPHANAACTH
jgi:hypothetical protein